RSTCIPSSFSQPPPSTVLLSFPTRRSSDLQHRLPLVTGHGDHGLEGAVGVGEHQHAALLLRGRLERGGERVIAAEGGGRGDLPRDRKSTRLNSSHVSISYAVFCLKKYNTGV